MVMEAMSKKGEQSKTLGQAAENAASDCSSISRESLATSISDYRTNEKKLLILETCKEERRKGEAEIRNCLKKAEIKIFEICQKTS